MTKQEFTVLARQEMSRFALSGWSFAFDNAKVIFGRCYFYNKKITMSLPLFEANKTNNFIQVWDTLLHEMAHALAFIHDNHHQHGKEWKEWCVKVGAKPQRCYTDAEVTAVTHKYHLVNSKTGEVAGKYHRKPRWVKDCGLSFWHQREDGTHEHYQLVPNKAK